MASLSMIELYEENDEESLKQNIKKLEDGLDNRQQELYNLKRELDIVTKLEDDYEECIGALKASQSKEELQLKEQIEQLEREFKWMTNNCSDMLQEKIDTISSLAMKKSKLIALVNSKKKTQNKPVDDDIEMETKERLRKISDQLIEQQMQIDHLQNENKVLETKKMNLAKDLEKVKRSVASHRMELNIVKSKIKERQQEYANKLNMVSVRNKPLNPSTQGNSLFAEVHDSSLKLEQKIKHYKKHYLEMEMMLMKKDEEVKNLFVDGEKVCSELETILDYENLSSHDTTEFNEKMNELTLEIENICEQIKEDFKIDGPELVIDYAKVCLKSKWNDSLKLLETWRSMIKENINICMQLTQANCTQRKLERDVLRLKMKKIELESNLSELQHHLLSMDKDENKVVEENKEDLVKNENATMNDEVVQEKVKNNMIQFSPVKDFKMDIIHINDSDENISADQNNLEHVYKKGTIESYYTLTHTSPNISDDKNN
ncbi:hypothetical protein FQA39_LY10221 [Lamprigera yunnana]|nr:hypothetical protein FQA39_LY10221 [Lamprigera yunnana]